MSVAGRSDETSGTQNGQGAAFIGKFHQFLIDITLGEGGYCGSDES